MRKLLLVTIVLAMILAGSCAKKADKKTEECKDHTHEDGKKCDQSHEHEKAHSHDEETDHKYHEHDKDHEHSNDCKNKEDHECENDHDAEHHHDNVKWGNDVDAALAKATKSDEIIMIDFTATWCPPCRQMEKVTFPDHNVIHKMENFIPVRIDVDQNQDVANEYNGNANKYGGKGIPNILFMDKDKNVIRHIVGFHSPEKLINVMDSVLTGKY